MKILKSIILAGTIWITAIAREMRGFTRCVGQAPILAFMVMMVLLVAALLIGPLTSPASGQGTTAPTTVYQPSWYKVYGPVTLTNGESRTLAVTNFWDTLRPNAGEAVFMQIGGTNAQSTNTVTASFDVTPDGSTFTTTQPFKFSQAGAGTNTAMGFTNWPPTGTGLTLNNLRQIAMTGLLNNNTNTNGITVTLWLSRANN